MYIRWKEKPREPQWGYDANHHWRSGVAHKTMLLSAYLVESKRVDGKPRQKTIYLASIRERFLPYANHRLYFWKRVQAKLNTLNLSPEQLQTVKEKLAERVPDVTQEQLQTQEEELGRLMRNVDARLVLCQAKTDK